MGFSRLEYPYAGGDQLFPVNFALGVLSRDDVTVYVSGDLDGFGDQVYQAATWEGDNYIRVMGALPNPCIVIIDRTVDKDQLILDVSGTSAFTRTTLVNGFTQLMMAMHELLDGRVDEFTDIVQIQALVTSALSAAESAGVTQDEAEALLNAATLVLDQATSLEVAAGINADNAAISAEDAAASAVLSMRNANAYPVRSEFVADALYTPAAGTVVTAGGQSYVRQAGATAIPDLLDWLPFGDVFPDQFGDVAGDVGPLLVAASALGLPIRGGQEYTIASTATFSVPVDLRGIRLTWNGAAQGIGIVLGASGSKINNCTFDGADLACVAISDPSGDNDVTGCDMRNLRATTRSALGIDATSLTGSRYRGNQFFNIVSVGDATTGNDNGASRAIRVQTTAQLLLPYIIEGNECLNIRGEEGDAIQVICYNSGTNTFFEARETRVVGNTITSPSKRGIKIQASDVFVDGNTVEMRFDGVDKFAAIDVLNGSRVRVTNNSITITVEGVRGINITKSSDQLRTTRNIIAENRILLPSTAVNFAVSVFSSDRAIVRGNKYLNGYIGVQDSSHCVVTGNVSDGMMASGTLGPIHIQAGATQCIVDSNHLTGGASYCFINVQAVRTVVKDNNVRALNGTEPYPTVYVQTNGNVITGNINAQATIGPVRFSGATSEAAQTLTSGNVVLPL